MNFNELNLMTLIRERKSAFSKFQKENLEEKKPIFERENDKFYLLRYA